MEMKATGIVRRFDDLGRIVIPKEIRKRFGFSEGAPADIFTTNDGVVLKLYRPYEGATSDSAVHWLNEHADVIKRYSAKFETDGDTTTCEVIVRDGRRVGKAKKAPDDRFDVNIGMVYAFCRATGIPLPDDWN